MLMEVAVTKFGNVWFGVVCEKQRVFASAFADSSEEVLACLQKKVPQNQSVQVVSESSANAEGFLSLMKRIYGGEDVSVDAAALVLERFPLYTQRVLRAVAHIPVGYVASYGGVAEAAGGGPRAVGNIMSSNAFAPLVPCHRVVTSSLGLGGYGGGLRLKFELLRREKRGFAEERNISVEGGVMRIFPVDHVLERLETKLPWREL